MRKITTHIGIDIGLQGGICIMAGKEIYTTPMPLQDNYLDAERLYKTLAMYQNTGHVTFESLHSLYSASKSSTWSLAHQSGIIEGVCVALEIPYLAVPPKQWQKEMFEGIPPIRKTSGKADTKAMALIAVKRLFPEVNLLATGRSKVPHNGIVDAVLLAEYGRRHFKD